MHQQDLASLLQRHAADTRVPGAAIGILDNGAVTTAYCGVANAASGEPITPETRFSAGSLTNSMVATVIARLARDGHLSLDDLVTHHLPELPKHGWAEQATLRDLLANRAGIALSTDLEFGFDAHDAEDDGALARLVAEIPPSTNTGFWSYANLGWCVLGRVIETTSELSWEQAMERLLFDEVGMTHTSCTISVSTPRASGHDLTATEPVPVEPMTSRAYGPAGTTVTTTVEDLLHLALRHLEDRTLDQLRIVHAELEIPYWLDSWCLGWAKFDWSGEPIWGWDGIVPGERCFLRMSPERQLAVAVMTNGSAGRAMARSLFADLAQSEFGVLLPLVTYDDEPPSDANLADYAGVYAWPDREFIVTATSAGLRIVADGSEVAAVPVGPRSLLLDPGDPDCPVVTFAGFDGKARPQVLYDAIWGYPRIAE
jgi:CubicO group peptidase (beta-lactamase class C family)